MADVDSVVVVAVPVVVSVLVEAHRLGDQVRMDRDRKGRRRIGTNKESIKIPVQQKNRG